jgi:hypothetical protein
MYERLHLLSQEPIESVKNVLDAVLTLLVLNYAEGEETSIPGIGVIKTKYNGDHMVATGKQAQIMLTVIPDDVLIKNIGQVEDKVESDIEKRYKMKIKSLLTDIVQK